MAKGKASKSAKTENKETPKGRQLARREPDLGSLLAAPSDLMRRFRDEMDRLFEDFGFGNLASSLRRVITAANAATVASIAEYRFRKASMQIRQPRISATECLR